LIAWERGLEERKEGVGIRIFISNRRGKETGPEGGKKRKKKEKK